MEGIMRALDRDMTSLEERPMRIESRWRIGRRAGQALLGLIFAMSIVAVAVFGPPLTGQSIVPMIELRHDVLMIDREFERSPALVNRSSGPGRLITDDLCRKRSTNAASKARARGGIA
jgi:hypothetical protein